MKTPGGEMYAMLFSEKLPQLLLKAMQMVAIEGRYILCKMRRTWDGVFAVEVLSAVDAKVRQVYPLWPYFNADQARRFNEVDRQMELLRKEIRLLEQQQNSSKICDNKKRCRTEVDGEEFSKRRNVVRNKKCASFYSESEMNVLSPRSSVLLTPSPEPEKCDSDASLFWTNLNSMNGEKSNSPIFMGPTKSLPFFSHFVSNDQGIAVELMEFCKTNSHEISAKPQSMKNYEEPKNEESAEDNELELIEPNVPFVNLDNYEETLCTNLNAIIKTEVMRPEYGDDDEEELTSDNIIMATSSIDSKRTTPPPAIDIDGNIEPQRIIPSTSKRIKINLINPKVIEESRAESTPSPKQTVEEQSKQKKPSEWQTPSISFERKETMKNTHFREQPIYRNGWEQSGLCSIM